MFRSALLIVLKMSTQNTGKRRRSSGVWEFFQAVDAVFATCNMCKTKLSYKTSVTNLKRHTSSRHPTVTIPSVVKPISSVEVNVLFMLITKIKIGTLSLYHIINKSCSSRLMTEMPILVLVPVQLQWQGQHQQ